MTATIRARTNHTNHTSRPNRTRHMDGTRGGNRAIITSVASPERRRGAASRRCADRTVVGRAGAVTSIQRREALTARPSEATFRRRRAVVGITLAVLVAVGVVAAHDVLAGSGGDPASAAASQPALVHTVVAQPGDTLWSIAKANRGDISITRYVDALVDLNDGASIEAGQIVSLP